MCCLAAIELSEKQTESGAEQHEHQNSEEQTGGSQEQHEHRLGQTQTGGGEEWHEGHGCQGDAHSTSLLLEGSA